MKSLLFAVILTSTLSFAAGKSNAILQATMKAIAKDVAFVSEPANQETPADVTDAMILMAIARARTAAFQLELVADRKETEMFPAVLEGVPPETKSEKLKIFDSQLRKAASALKSSEEQLKIELAKTIEQRNFGPLQQTLGELRKTIKEAHQLFHPEE